MILTISIISIVFLLFFFIILQSLEKKKYQKPVYKNNLEQVTDFLDHIQKLNDYFTWVERDQITSKYSAAGKFFKNKTNYYKKEEAVKKFNEIFGDFSSYVVQYNQNYVNTQKDKLSQYFDNIEGKKLDDQQRSALITDEYSNLIIAGAGSGKTLTTPLLPEVFLMKSYIAVRMSMTSHIFFNVLVKSKPLKVSRL